MTDARIENMTVVVKVSSANVLGSKQKNSLVTKKKLGSSPFNSNNNITQSKNSMIEITNDKQLSIYKPFESSPIKPNAKSYTFDKILSEDATNFDIFQQTSDVVKSAVEGFNGSVIAYGILGSGKTYTLQGDTQNPGLVSYTVKELFSQIKSQSRRKKQIYVEISFVELYNNQFHNLLSQLTELDLIPNVTAVVEETQDDASAKVSTSNSSKSKPKWNQSSEHINIHENSAVGVFLSGPNNIRMQVKNAEEAMLLITKANKNVSFRSTETNPNSSRGHTVLTFHLEIRDFKNNALIMNKLQLIDLAGTENLANSTHSSDETATETKNINTSISALGDVLSTLSTHSASAMAASSHSSSSDATEGSTPPHNGTRRNSIKSSDDHSIGETSKQHYIPYKNSKLTHLLKESLGGNTKTVFLVHLRSEPTFYQQATTVLMYATWACKIRQKVFIFKQSMSDLNWGKEDDPEVARLKRVVSERSKKLELDFLSLPDGDEEGGEGGEGGEGHDPSNEWMERWKKMETENQDLIRLNRELQDKNEMLEGVVGKAGGASREVQALPLKTFLDESTMTVLQNKDIESLTQFQSDAVQQMNDYQLKLEKETKNRIELIDKTTSQQVKLLENEKQMKIFQLEIDRLQQQIAKGLLDRHNATQWDETQLELQGKLFVLNTKWKKNLTDFVKMNDKDEEMKGKWTTFASSDDVMIQLKTLENHLDLNRDLFKVWQETLSIVQEKLLESEKKLKDWEKKDEGGGRDSNAITSSQSASIGTKTRSINEKQFIPLHSDESDMSMNKNNNKFMKLFSTHEKNLMQVEVPVQSSTSSASSFFSFSTNPTKPSNASKTVTGASSSSFAPFSFEPTSSSAMGPLASQPPSTELMDRMDSTDQKKSTVFDEPSEWVTRMELLLPWKSNSKSPKDTSNPFKLEDKMLMISMHGVLFVSLVTSSFIGYGYLVYKSK